MWEQYLQQIVVWYWLLAIGTILLTITATVIHQSWLPLIFGGTISAILVLFPSYLEPLLFGWMTHPSLLMATLSFIFFVMWILAFGQAMYNGLRYGKVTA